MNEEMCAATPCEAPGRVGFLAYNLSMECSDNGGLVVRVGCKTLVYVKGEEEKLISDFSAYVRERERCREKVLSE